MPPPPLSPPVQCEPLQHSALGDSLQHSALRKPPQHSALRKSLQHSALSEHCKPRLCSSVHDSTLVVAALDFKQRLHDDDEGMQP